MPLLQNVIVLVRLGLDGHNGCSHSSTLVMEEIEGAACTCLDCEIHSKREYRIHRFDGNIEFVKVGNDLRVQTVELASCTDQQEI